MALAGVDSSPLWVVKVYQDGIEYSRVYKRHTITYNFRLGPRHVQPCSRRANMDVLSKTKEEVRA